MTPIYATWADVTASYELDIPVEHQPRIEKLLTRASARLTAMVPSLPARISAKEVDPELPSGMVVEAVLRAYRNPVGATQQSTGPFSRSLNSQAARGDIYFDPEQVQLLAAVSPEVGTFHVAVPRHHSSVGGLDTDGRYRNTPEWQHGVQGRW